MVYYTVVCMVASGVQVQVNARSITCTCQVSCIHIHVHHSVVRFCDPSKCALHAKWLSRLTCRKDCPCAGFQSHDNRASTAVAWQQHRHFGIELHVERTIFYQGDGLLIRVQT